MGYSIDLVNSKFFIAAADKEAALAAMFKMWEPSQEGLMSGGSLTEKWYSWMNTSADAWRRQEILSLEEGLGEWGYYPETDDEGNIIDLQFDGEKIGDEDIMFKAIAPWVKAGSFLDFHGEDGDLWRWEFDGETYVWKTGKVIYD